MEDQLEEVILFLKNNSRIELKSVALSNIVSKFRLSSDAKSFVNFHDFYQIFM